MPYDEMGQYYNEYKQPTYDEKAAISNINRREQEYNQELIEQNNIARENSYNELKKTLDNSYNNIVDQSSAKSISNVELFEIGKPRAFRPEIDQEKDIGNYLKSKMSIIDIVPTNYQISYKNAEQKIENNNSLLDVLTHSLDYGDSTDKFRKVCEYYGLPNNYAGVRLFISDDSTSTDDFNNNFEPNLLQNITDPISTSMRKARNMTSTFYGSKGDEILATQANDLLTGAQNAINALIPNNGASGSSVGRIADQSLRSLINTTARGNTIPWPQNWSGSSYAPNLTAVVKLVSPYGHPDAIQKFIIKPLMYLLICSSPFTQDGIGYGNPSPCTVNAYGIAHMPLAAIQNISLRRGGSDTSFNIYRQPLSIDVSIMFRPLIEGFGVIEPVKDINLNDTIDKDVYKRSANILDDSRRYDVNQSSLMPTLGKIVHSLRPFGINKNNPLVSSDDERPKTTDVAGNESQSTRSIADSTTDKNLMAMKMIKGDTSSDTTIIDSSMSA